MKTISVQTLKLKLIESQEQVRKQHIQAWVLLENNLEKMTCPTVLSKCWILVLQEHINTRSGPILGLTWGKFGEMEKKTQPADHQSTQNGQVLHNTHLHPTQSKASFRRRWKRSALWNEEAFLNPFLRRKSNKMEHSISSGLQDVSKHCLGTTLTR